MRRLTISTRTDTLFPYTTLFRSGARLARDLPRFIRTHEAATAASRDSRMHAGIPARRTDEEKRCRCRSKIWNRSEEHTSELQSLMRISYAVFCLKKTKTTT